MLNHLIQKEINPNINSNEFHLKGKFTCNDKEYEIKFYKGDKIINVKNDYSIPWYDKINGEYILTKDTGITNGECGIIESLKYNQDTHKFNIIVNFDDKYIIFEDSSNLELAYALTIHKSQGSQWEHILLPIVSMHKYILSNNLLYTGITRASEEVIVIGDKLAMNFAIKTHKEYNRNTTLVERIHNECEKYLE